MARNINKISDSIKSAKTIKPRKSAFIDDDCPVTPLGTKNGVYYYIDALKQFRELKDRDHGRMIVMGLFGHEIQYLFQGRYARKDDDEHVKGWKPEEVGKDLMAACAEQGVWEPFEKVRGSGAWKDEDDNIVIHCGNKIFINNHYSFPGVVGSFVYPAEPPRQSPADTGATTEEIKPLLDLLKTWSWFRADLDATLLLGWIASAFIGGALKWRPLMWLTGSAGTGKSTLQEVIHSVFAGSLLSVSDPTPAGIWQKTQYSSLPVAIDEAEPEDGSKIKAVIKLARQACSGGVILRGSSEGTASEFKARNCYLFSSILVPPLTPQDRSRIAILELGLIGGNPPRIDKAELRSIGSKILRRMIDNFEIFTNNIGKIWLALAKVGFDSRGCDEFGTLIAAADILLSDGEMTSDDAAEWAEKMKQVLETERMENDPDSISCIQHLLTSPCDSYRDGKKRTIGDFIAEAAMRENTNNSRPGPDDAAAANKVLAAYGLKVDKRKVEGKPDEMYLFIANKHQGLNRVYQNTVWVDGVWRQSFRRFKTGFAYGGVLRFGGVPSKCSGVAIDEILGEAPN